MIDVFWDMMAGKDISKKYWYEYGEYIDKDMDMNIKMKWNGEYKWNIFSFVIISIQDMGIQDMNINRNIDSWD